MPSEGNTSSAGGRDELGTEGQRRLTRNQLLAGWIGFVVLAGIAGLYALHAGRDTVFRGDDWDLLFGRQGGGFDVYLDPHVDHLLAGEVIAYKAIVGVVGPRYAAFRIALVIAVLFLGAALFVFLRRRLGAWVALPLVGLILFMGAGADNLLWPTQLSTVLSVALGIAVLLLLETDSARHRVCGSLLLVAAVACGSDGLFFVLACGIWFVLDPVRRRALWVPAIPAVLYGIWYLHYGGSTGSSSDFGDIPTFAFDLIAAGFAGLMGLPAEIGYPRSHPIIWGSAGIGIFLVAALLAKPLVTPRLVAIVSLLAADCGSIAVGRATGGDPYATRYTLLTGVFILMAGAEIFKDRRISPRATVGVIVLSLVAIVTGGITLERVGDTLRLESQDIRARVGAMEDARRTVDPDYGPGPIPETGNLSAGWYFAGIEDFGRSAVGGPTVGGVALDRLDEPARTSADEVSAAAIPAIFVPGGQALRVGTGAPVAATGSLVPSGPGCAETGGLSAAAEIEIPPAGLVLRAEGSAELRLRLRRFGPVPPLKSFASISSRPRLLVIPRDLAGGQWLASISGRGRAVVCTAEAPLRLRRGNKFPAHGDQGCGAPLLGVERCIFDRR